MDKLIKILFLAFFPFLALVNYEPALDDSLTPRYLTGSFLLLVILCLMLLKKTKFSFSKTEKLIWLGIYIILLLNWFNLKNHSYWMFIFSKINFLFAFHLVASNLLRYYSLKFYLIKTLLITLFLIEGKVLIQIGTLQIDSFNDVFQINGGFGHKNILSFVLIVLMILITPIWKTAVNKWLKYLFILAEAIGFSIILILQTRSVWLIIGLIFCAIFIFKRELIISHFKLIFKCLIISGLSISSFLFIKPDFLASTTAKLNVNNDVAYKSIDERLFLWKNSLSLIKDNWLTGVGAGNWKTDFISYGVSGTRAGDGLINFIRPHNDFLWLFSEFGIPGVLIFVLVIVYVFKKSIKRFKTEFFLSILPLLFLVFSNFSFPVERPFVILLFILTMCFFGNEHIGIKRLHYIICPLLIVSCFVFMNRFNASVSSENVIKAYRDNKNKKLIKHASKCIELGMNVDEQGTAIEWYKGVAYSNLKNQNKSFESFKRAYEFAPNHVHVINNLASSFYLKNMNKEAEVLYRRGIQLSSDFDEIFINYAAMLFNEKRYQEAFQIIKKCPPNSNHPNYKIFYNAIKNKQ